MPRARVLITGNQGFTGQYVAAEFSAAGYDVWGTGLGPSITENPQYARCDLTDKHQVSEIILQSQPDIVVHLAGISFVGHGKLDDFYRINLVATQLLLDALTQYRAGSEGILLPSSAIVYGNTDAAPISEEAPTVPGNDYAVSKVAMELMAQLRFADLPIVVVRPFNYTGRLQDNKFLVPKIVEHYRQRVDRIELGNLDVARDFSDVRDVAAIYRQLIEARPWGQIVNICSGVATSLTEILAICEGVTGHQIAPVVSPTLVRDKEIKTLTGDTTKLNMFLPGLERRSIANTLEWMLSA